MLVAGFALGVPAKALAQDPVPSAPPVVLGVTGSLISDFREFGLISGGPLILLPDSPSNALQLGFELSPHAQGSGTDLHAIYTVQLRHTFGRDLARPRMYVTAGGAGYFHYQHVGPSSYFTPERAKTVSATGVVTSTTPAHWTDVPARTSFNMSLPLAPIAGVGVEGRATPRVGFQADVTASAWPAVAFRFSAGLSIGIGRMR
jgi:hypothetical protein